MLYLSTRQTIKSSDNVLTFFIWGHKTQTSTKQEKQKNLFSVVQEFLKTAK